MLVCGRLRLTVMMLVSVDKRWLPKNFQGLHSKWQRRRIFVCNTNFGRSGDKTNWAGKLLSAGGSEGQQQISKEFFIINMRACFVILGAVESIRCAWGISQSTPQVNWYSVFSNNFSFGFSLGWTRWSCALVCSVEVISGAGCVLVYTVRRVCALPSTCAMWFVVPAALLILFACKGSNKPRVRVCATI